MPKNASKLDFTWFEYPVERFEEIVVDYLQFWEDFKARNGGFEPTGMYVYRRSQARYGSLAHFH